MAKKKLPKHTHKYHRILAGFKKIWACADSECTHFMPEHLTSTIIGKKSICWQCNNEFILDDDSMKNDRPICRACSRPAINFDAITDLLENGKKIS
ncbi:MAG TPA: hypothetical protein VNX68_06305 [Nitrosopumilaceae archaeon]|nr:hypothetical protein [Nitrosopumilaceae archaeon]